MFVPSSKQRMVEKSVGLSSLDIALYDLEDGVLPAEKPAGRDNIRALLARPRPASTPARFVRTNSLGSGPERIEADLEAAVRPGLDGLVLPKVDDPEQLKQFIDLVESFEVAAGVERGSTSIIAAIESATGLFNARATAQCSRRLVGLLFGAEDYALDLGLPAMREAESRDLLFARSMLVNAAVAAGIDAFDGVWPDIDDVDGLRSDVLQARRLGFTGKSTFHPSQIELINSVFSPGEAEVAYATRVVEAFQAAEARGDGAVALGGQLLDLPIVERARRTLMAAQSTRAQDPKDGPL